MFLKNLLLLTNLIKAISDSTTTITKDNFRTIMMLNKIENDQRMWWSFIFCVPGVFLLLPTKLIEKYRINYAVATLESLILLSFLFGKLRLFLFALFTILFTILNFNSILRQTTASIVSTFILSEIILVPLKLEFSYYIIFCASILLIFGLVVLFSKKYHEKITSSIVITYLIYISSNILFENALLNLLFEDQLLKRLSGVVILFILFIMVIFIKNSLRKFDLK
ncbi:hypothetical protein A0H76_2012 [Hepatospora eriocheir]|uniref:Uncharacterized protein n=1 Tax=Hepatospora eriocheir TaxID=1081669 RepID=A0A1X0QKF8_9MICR|nr:hypothetical protein A0H76_2012 [Hepatospora eriocheir]